MKSLSFVNSYWKLLLSAAFGMGVFIFWLQGYPFLLLGTEESHLFLWDGEYLTNRLSLPGGLARYSGDFLSQFFFDIRLGAFINAMLLVVQQRLVWWLMRRNGVTNVGTNSPYYLLSFVPSLILWYLQGDLNIQMTFPVAVVLTTLMMAMMPRRGVRGLIALAIGVAVAYWLTGPVAVMLVFAVFMLKDVSLQTVLLGFVVLAAVFAGSLVGSSWMVYYPFNELCQGINYCFQEDSVSVAGELALMATILALPLIARRWLLPDNRRLALSFGLAVALVGVLLVPKGFPAADYEEVEYDALARLGLWRHIEEKSTAQAPRSAACQLVVWHALCVSGKADDQELFLALASNDPMKSQWSAFMMSEIFFLNGLVNKSQHAAFEAMEALYYNKSGRGMRRLVETNLITGHYDVALKYIRLLEETIYYSKWARKMRPLAEHPEQLDLHPVYGRLRHSYALTPDQLFN